MVRESGRGGKAPETRGARVRPGAGVCGEVGRGGERGLACDAPRVGGIVVGAKGVERGEAGVSACEAGEGHRAWVRWKAVAGGYWLARSISVACPDRCESQDVAFDRCAGIMTGT